jgi:hypothetical protein
MSEETSSPTPESTRRRLSGWKEIAAYFDRSVRTVQRWEAEHRLPIRRLGMGRAEVVTALVADLERWRESAEAQAAGQAADPTEAGPMPPISPALPGSRFRSRLWLLAVAAGFLLVVVSLGAWWKWAGPTAPEAGEPHTIRVVDKHILVLDALGRSLWTHEFAEAPGATLDEQGIADLDADGHNEVLLISGRPGRSPGGVKLYCFNHLGGLLWTHQQTKPQTFGSEVYAPPFVPKRIYVTDAPARKKWVWLTSVHIPWFPSVLQKLDPTGAVRGEYWSNGYITSLETAQWEGRRVVIVGARDNEHGSASLAVLDEDQPSGAAPAADPRYQCRSCPAGAPLAFVVFPKPRRLAQLSGTASVEGIQTDVNGSVVVWVNFAMDFRAATIAFFTLDRQLRPIRVDTADTFETSCLELVRNGTIAPFAPGTGLDELRSVLWWDGIAFKELKAQLGPERPVK